MVPTPTHPFRWAWPLAGFALSAAAQSQVAPPGAAVARPDPLNPQAAVPVLVYESAFARYRRTGDDKPIPWRSANDTVTRIGGWRVYTREAQQPDDGAKAP